ncbi:PLP-dependent transferase [Nadsonia fulvescens var. elongata DSM 6958]|uniref:aspartate transaminase n=1 Tax=Nadsonia fulvescens var. elongata DSM 6958 TaxID=857566 RepID=A0A1E3PJS5_9ASCO|nr:PLP-dependent transferase [Nadsonia fulvescens var. elongata DSM 6958]
MIAAPPSIAPDPIFHLIGLYKADTRADKADLGVGAYRSNEGKPWILPCVKAASERIQADPSYNHEYLAISGLDEYTKSASKVIFGQDSALLKSNRVSSFQTVSGTGANHLGAAFLSKFNSSKTIWVSDPTWGNHFKVFETANLQIKVYPYWDPATRGLNWEALKDTLQNQTSPGDIILLHACAHNPTGVDPTHQQWEELSEIISAKQLYPFFDAAYQGFASGDLDHDAFAIRYFAERHAEFLVCQSFAKNFGLYGERTGALHIVSKTSVVARAVDTQLSALQRAEISSPPAYGAKIVAAILADPELYQQWRNDLITMSARIKEMRTTLKSHLESLKTPGTWDHLVDQIGMFAYTGLTPGQCQRLVNEFSIYLSSNGRVSMAGFNDSNVKSIAKAIDTVVRETK